MPKEQPKGPPEWEAVPQAPPPAAASSAEGMEHAREMARRYLPDVVRSRTSLCLRSAAPFSGVAGVGAVYLM
jgi:hypothetical protein